MSVAERSLLNLANSTGNLILYTKTVLQPTYKRVGDFSGRGSVQLSRCFRCLHLPSRTHSLFLLVFPGLVAGAAGTELYRNWTLAVFEV